MVVGEQKQNSWLIRGNSKYRLQMLNKKSILADYV